jgi:hypothetical protein
MSFNNKSFFVVDSSGVMRWYKKVPVLYDVNSATAVCCQAGLPKFKTVRVEPPFADKLKKLMVDLKL